MNKLLKEGNWNLRTGLNNMWNQMANCIERITKDVLSEPKGKRYTKKKDGSRKMGYKR